MREAILDTITVLAALAAVTLMASSFRSKMVPLPPGDETPLAVADWESLHSGGNWIGSREARVVIVEFGDYQCPACRRFHRVVDQLMKTHREDVALVYRHWPLTVHPLAYSAAKAAECAADQGVFEPFHSFLYDDPSWIAMPEAAFRGFAERSAVPDLTEFSECLAAVGDHPRINEDVNAVRAIGGRGTPTLIINGMLLRTVPDSAELSGLVERLLDTDAL